MSNGPELFRRALKYCEGNGLVLGDSLGSGVHGSVFAVESQSEIDGAAIKVHEREGAYRRERDVYLRLTECGIVNIRGCDVPELLRNDDELWIIEMTIVARPFVLDFAGAYLDQAPDYSEEVLADWRAEKQEQFGARWGEVQAILRSLQGYGVFMADVNPGNIAFGDEAPCGAGRGDRPPGRHDVESSVEYPIKPHSVGRQQQNRRQASDPFSLLDALASFHAAKRKKGTV